MIFLLYCHLYLWSIRSASPPPSMNPQPRTQTCGTSLTSSDLKGCSRTFSNFLKVPWKVRGRCPSGEEGAVCSIWIWSASLHGGGSGQGHASHLLCHPGQAAQVIANCQARKVDQIEGLRSPRLTGNLTQKITLMVSLSYQNRIMSTSNKFILNK